MGAVKKNVVLGIGKDQCGKEFLRWALEKVADPGDTVLALHICPTSANLIGTGGCNSVYKGVLPDGKKIATKVMISSKEAHKDFIKEVDIMTTIKHERITPFLGICIENDKLISVYELLQRGNLEQNLQGDEKGKNPTPWEVRFKIAHGIAEVLDYLHNASPHPIIHRDVKSSNILLTNELKPQLSDFGLAIWGPPSSSFLMDNDLVGTFGYLAPEYFMYGRARPKLKSADVSSILDPNLNGKFDYDQVQKLALAAKLCLAQSATLVFQILHVLEGNGNGNIPESSAESHLTVAFLDVNEDSESSSSSPLSVEEYLKKRWSSPKSSTSN